MGSYVEGVEAVEALLNPLTTIEQTLAPVVREVEQEVLDKWSVYPSPTARSKRTYNLRGGWSIKGNEVLNAVDYAPFVVGFGTQRPWNVGRWPNDAQVAAEVQDNAVDRADDFLNDLLG